jgi:hypothetical protein
MRKNLTKQKKKDPMISLSKNAISVEDKKRYGLFFLLGLGIKF